MAFHKLLTGGCGAAVGVLALYRKKSWATPVHADECQEPPRVELEENPQICPTVTSLQEWDCNWDKRNKLKAGAARHIILTPGGNNDWKSGESGKYYLTDLGRKLGNLVGGRLKDFGCPWTRIISWSWPSSNNPLSSNIPQATQVIASHLPGVPVYTMHLGGQAPCSPEPPVINSQARWVNGAPRHHVDGPQMEAGFRELFYRSSSDQTNETYEIVICGTFHIQYLVCRALQFPPEAWYRLQLAYWSITWLTILGDGRVIMQTFGETGHLPPDTIQNYN